MTQEIRNRGLARNLGKHTVPGFFSSETGEFKPLPMQASGGTLGRDDTGFYVEGEKGKLRIYPGGKDGVEITQKSGKRVYRFV